MAYERRSSITVSYCVNTNLYGYTIKKAALLRVAFLLGWTLPFCLGVYTKCGGSILFWVIIAVLYDLVRPSFYYLLT